MSLLIGVGALPWLLLGLSVDHDIWWRLYQPLCHQIPERSLLVHPIMMVVCSRCAGLYGGMVIGSLLSLVSLPTTLLRQITIIAVVLMIAEVVTQEIGLHGIYHPTRLASGLLLATSGVSWALSLLRREAMA